MSQLEFNFLEKQKLAEQTKTVDEVMEGALGEGPAEKKEEWVNHPKHYNHGKIEVIDVIEDWGLDFLLGNVVKYVGRSGKKTKSSELEDLSKAKWYLDRKISSLSKKST
jgi:hypothetical protein